MNRDYATPISGVYAITNTVDGKQYVGSSQDIELRWDAHKRILRRNAPHHARYLQHAWNQYGEAAFTFSILEEVSDQDALVAREQFYLDTLHPVYNSRQNAESNRGYKCRPRSAEYRAKLSARQKGVKRGPLPPETRAKLSAINKGRQISAEARERGAAKQRGVPRPYSGQIMRARAHQRREALATITEKTCHSCHVLLPVSAFHRHRRYADGYSYQCRSCASEEKRRQYQIRAQQITEQTGMTSRQRKLAGLLQRQTARHQDYVEQTLIALQAFWRNRTEPVSSLWNLAYLLAQQTGIAQMALYQRLRRMASEGVISASGRLR